LAKLVVYGIDTEKFTMAKLAELPESVIKGMLEAEADVVASASKAAAESMGVRDSGQVIASIRKGRFKRTRDGAEMWIIPKGNRRSKRPGQRNAEVAFLAEYGQPTRGVSPRPFMRLAVAQSEGKAQDAAEKVYDEYIKSFQ
jgi:hypothetical protein